MDTLLSDLPGEVLRSPVQRIGGKHFSASRIVAAFPAHNQYQTYIDVFGGAAHVLLRKPLFRRHLEVYNDLDGELVNFWMCCRDKPDELEARVETLPYSRELYHRWQAELEKDQRVDHAWNVERAARWFYLMRSGFGGKTTYGWGYEKKNQRKRSVNAFRSATALFQAISERFHLVQIDCRDFETIIKTYDSPTSLFYCDPPYIGYEKYYSGTPQSFTEHDHRRLAALLQQVQGMVALSYYPHALVEDLYPERHWRRLTWSTYKHAENCSSGSARQTVTELLLLNYKERGREQAWQQDLFESKVSPA
jgi:DNA adenine methylase